MMVAIITENEYKWLAGAVYDGGGSAYYPIRDAKGNWVITQTEIERTTNQKFEWVAYLSLTQFDAPAPPPLPFITVEKNSQ